MFDEVIDRRNTGSLKWDRYPDREVLPMWVADMDFRSPEPVLEALRRRTRHGVFGYTEPQERLVDTVMKYLGERHDFPVQRDWILWLPGLVPALNIISRAFSGSLLTATPIYPPFLFAPEYAEKELVRVPLRVEENRWTWDWERLEEAVRPDTRVLLLCHPHNPVGRVFGREELGRLAAFAARHDLIVSSDEIHCDLILDPGLRHIPFATLSSDARERTISLFAPSKTYNLPGLACAFAVIPNKELRHAFRKTARGIITEVNAMGYAACEAAYAEGEPWRLRLIDQLRRNRDRLQEFLSERVPQVVTTHVEATYLAWIDVRPLSLDNPASHFEKHGLGLSDGRLFGMPGFLRMNFGCPPSVLEEGLRRFERAANVAR